MKVASNAEKKNYVPRNREMNYHESNANFKRKIRKQIQNAYIKDLYNV
jgi:hypothetical protein